MSACHLRGGDVWLGMAERPGAHGSLSLFSLRVEEGKDKNDAAAAAGMSCGELAALCAAGCFSFEDGVRLARVRGEVMKKAVEVRSASA